MASTNYTEENFPEVVKGDEFLNLTREEVCYLISSDQLSVGSEERVFESVINWVRHDVQSRKKCLPDLLEHVRMPLLSKGKNQYVMGARRKPSRLVHKVAYYFMDNSMEDDPWLLNHLSKVWRVLPYGIRPIKIRSQN